MEECPHPEQTARARPCSASAQLWGQRGRKPGIGRHRGTLHPLLGPESTSGITDWHPACFVQSRHDRPGVVLQVNPPHVDCPLCDLREAEVRSHGLSTGLP